MESSNYTYLAYHLGLHRVGHDWSDLAAAAANHFFKSITLAISVTLPMVPSN